MDAFRWITGTLTILLSLGIARLLGSAVGLIRARRRIVFDWMPIAWAAYVFIAQLQFWWAIIELSRRDSAWSMGDFGGLVGMTLLLFLAAALVLPPEGADDGEMLGRFDDDGRFAVLAIAVYNSAAFLLDWLLWDLPLRSWTSVHVVVLALVPAAFLMLRARRAQRFTTLLYGVLLLAIDFELSPAAYR